MKIRLFALLLGVALAVACEKPEPKAKKNELQLANQQMEPVDRAPGAGPVTLEDLFVSIGRPGSIYRSAEDWGFLMILFCNDLEGADALIADSFYNWFSPCGDLSSRDPELLNPKIRYGTLYNMITSVNSFLGSFGEEVTDPDKINMIAQARALRAWSYMLWANDFQFSYQKAADKPAVQIMTQETDNPHALSRSSVKDVYNLILEDLDYAVMHLEGSSRISKMYIDGNVAHGLRARAYLNMGEWDHAYADAEAAAKGYSPATLEEVSKPYFYDISEHNWIWGYDMTTEVALEFRYATTSSWLRSFSGWGYATAGRLYTCINKLLYDKIPERDIRKQWWVDEDLRSTLLNGLTWPGFDDVAYADDGDEKRRYVPYTNVKFGCYKVGTVYNDEDMPLMRVEEMILIQAECLARQGNEAKAKKTLEDFVRTCRDESYYVNLSPRSLLDEIWFQRRVELWGEGFFASDMKRLDKPLVRFHDDKGNIAPKFRFNLPSDDPWLLLRFSVNVRDTNPDVVDNSGGHQPVTDEYPSLRDGVTD